MEQRDTATTQLQDFAGSGLKSCSPSLDNFKARFAAVFGFCNSRLFKVSNSVQAEHCR
ncbi:MAG: hypothetical protein WCR04_05615 [Fibrobacteraceae bacterium]